MQRVAIGRALVRRPKALLMDEPIGALDAKLREDMRTELKRLHIENDATTVYVTHDQVEAMSLADRIAVMNEGVLQQVGTPSEVYRHPVNLFVAQFIGSPVMNIMPANAERRTAARRSVIIGENHGGASIFRRTCRPKSRRRPKAGRSLPSASGRKACWCRGRQPPAHPEVEAHIIEPLGAYDIVDLKIGGRFLRARTPSRIRRQAGRPRLGPPRPGADAFLQQPLRPIPPHQAVGNSMAEVRLDHVIKKFGVTPRLSTI